MAAVGRNRRFTATGCQLYLLVWLALAEYHGQRKKKKNGSTKNLERSKFYIHSGQDDFARYDKDGLMAAFLYVNEIKSLSD